jgi:hypothetical protein
MRTKGAFFVFLRKKRRQPELGSLSVFRNNPMNAENLKYEEAEPKSRDEILKSLDSGDPSQIISALHSAAYCENDWRWVQSQCLRFLKDHDSGVRRAAGTFLGDVAAF